MNMKISMGILIAAVLLAGVGIVMAHDNFTETKQLIDSKISCDNLSNEQLEEIGDYLMEQMHPGEAHEAMHNMMGGEDSETTKLMHINMAKMMYCNEGEGMNNMMSMMSGDGGMMSGMMGMEEGGMMSSGMMGNNMMNRQMQTNMNGNMMQGMMGNNMMGSGMMGNWQNSRYWNFVNVLYIALLIGLVILVYFWIIKLGRK